jgi:copper chaperone CopZ
MDVAGWMSLSGVAKPTALSVCLVSIWLGLYGQEVFAFQRAALALTGSSCRESQPAIIDALIHLDGVARVETDVIPDHVLIDHDGRRLNEDQLAEIINTLHDLGGRCHAVLMRSCITARPMDEGLFSSRAR